MERLIDAFEALFRDWAKMDGDLAKTATFTLDNVHWEEPLCMPEPAGHPVADTHLEEACTHTGSPGSSAHGLASALWSVADRLEWRTSSRSRVDGPDMEIFRRNFTVASVIGTGGPLLSNLVAAGVSLQARDTYYPPHAHRAEESYWIIGGDGDWKVDSDPWFAVQAGDGIYHAPWARHAMQTNQAPLLTVWLWTSHLDSEVKIVRSQSEFNKTTDSTGQLSHTA